MQKHTKIYMDFFNIDHDVATGYYDYSACELCNGVCHDVHHVIFKSQGGKDNIENLIGLCRECHNKAHNGKLSKEDLQRIHDIHVFKHIGNSLKSQK